MGKKDRSTLSDGPHSATMQRNAQNAAGKNSQILCFIEEAPISLVEFAADSGLNVV